MAVSIFDKHERIKCRFRCAGIGKVFHATRVSVDTLFVSIPGDRGEERRVPSGALKLSFDFVESTDDYFSSLGKYPDIEVAITIPGQKTQKRKCRGCKILVTPGGTVEIIDQGEVFAGDVPWGK